ncbi:MAG: tol-pal system protein YbgF [Deltaproteobacteria bacterium]|nr:tol-pal system protein YbgF [Deltaproteobacteria bacterium]MCW9048850.1 tol-pal system protein YbgF [Deltaproteobacteria bacterium]
MRHLIVLLSFLLLAGCVPPSQNQLRVDMDLEQMKRRLAQLEVRNVEAVQSEAIGGESLERQVAELLAGLDNLRVEFQSVNGRLDDLGQDNRALGDELQMIKDDVGLQLNSLSNRLAEMDEKVSALPVQVQAQQQPAQTSEPALTAEQLYQNALDLIRNQNQFVEGRQMLETFVEKYPQHDLYVNAQYWTGEALYGEKKYELAILQFQDVISKYSTHPKAAAAMFKQALAFNALGDGQNARTTMQKLIEEYPDAAQVEAAKKYLGNE